MSFTAAQVIVEVREQMLDALAPFRYGDDFILRKINQVLRRIALQRPDLFAEVDTITCVAGGMQRTPTDSIRLMDVVANTDGVAPKEVNQDVLDMLVPAWEQLAPGPTTNWMRYPRDPNRFYVYPAARSTDTLELVYARCPPVYASGDVIVLQDVYMPMVIDGVCWMLESIDAEHVESGRAQMFKESYENALAAGLTARNITDTDTAGGPDGVDK